MNSIDVSERSSTNKSDVPKERVAKKPRQGMIGRAAKAKLERQTRILGKKKEKYKQLSDQDQQKFSLDYIFKSIEMPQRTLMDQVYGMNPMMSLYPYQQSSLAKMLQRETSPKMIDNALYVATTDNPVKYRNILDVNHIVDQMPQVEDVRGGILCEEMGTGKTVICIGM
ncbi:hypothetical protein SAMD00019534_038160 [Acytostelium subglobosum LB1]|uniref:hypothetical protein n=1 Tax=Acytostelium subglobosum LB1 TaxID=1410327 RepID=UPI000644D3B7|nr:hypothetical protein SAMD00019534_038160 [Acytostelium subglobosum LB1]GAM20641.1 hypothetical protein SAMD00019534_038160 [Acytostelium subglobosum LB1]|eukprot:XP_012760162.1 hypothetical protein SAMD00019534_038160 [Acytostelium subglobosum LB1]